MSSSIVHPLPAAAPARGPLRLCIALLVVTTITILKGAMTTSTGSGLAYRTWPDSDGEWMPRSSYTTLPGFFEHFHRVFGATAGLLALTLFAVVWFGRARERTTPAARGLSLAGLLLIVVQGVIGGVGVLLELPAVTSVLHGTLAQVTLATFACLGYQLSQRCRDTAPVTTVRPGGGRTFVLVALALLIVQTVVGALARHTNSPHALWTHVGNALIVFFAATIATAYAMGRLAEAPGVKGIARTIVLLLIVQIALGFVALAIRNSAGKTPENVANLGTAAVISVHVLLGAVLTTLMAALAAHVFRATRATDRGAARVVA